MKKRVCRTAVLIIVMVVIMAVSGNAGPQVIVLNYENGVWTPFGLLELDNGETFDIKIIGLKAGAGNYDIKIEGLEVPPPSATKRSSDSYCIPVKHNKRWQSYRVTVTNTTPNTPEPSRTWNIPVFTNAWAVDFSGAFTFDLLTNPVFYLEPEPDYANRFVVRKNPGAEDKVSLGAAAMVHLYHTKWSNIKKIELIWAPLSFGLGIGGNAEARYYLGTSLKFGNVFYLTVGGVVGKVDCLPANLKLDVGFTTDASALANLPRKYKMALFVGVSYAFTGGKSKERLEQTFSLSQ